MTSYPQDPQDPADRPYPGRDGFVEYGPSGAQAADPLVPTSFGDWLRKVVGVFSRSWQNLLVVQLAAALPGLLLAGVVKGALSGPQPPTGAALVGLSGGALLAAVIAVAFGLFAQGASVFLAVRDAAGRRSTAGEALSFAARRALPLFGWGLLATLMLVAGVVVFVLPGIYLGIVFAAALTGAVVIERRGIGRAFALVNRRFLPTAGRMLLAALVAALYNFLAGSVVGALADPASFTGSVLELLVTLPVSLAAVGVAVVTYAELRRDENAAVDTPALAAEMER